MQGRVLGIFLSAARFFLRWRGPSLACALLLSGCSHVFYQPDRVYYIPPERFDIRYEQHWIKTPDGTKLLAWFFPAKTSPARGTVVQFHGNGENMSSHYSILVWLVDHGYNLYAWDYRGYGVSEGEPDQENTNADALLALDQAWSLHERSTGGGGRGSFVVMGQSLGGVISLRALADWEKRDRVSLIVQDSTFMSYKKAARQALARTWITWLFQPLGALLVSNEYSSEPVIPKLKNRLLVIHDMHDPVVSYSNGEAIYNAWTGPKEFWTLDVGSHVGALGYNLDEHRKKFLSILDGLQKEKR